MPLNSTPHPAQATLPPARISAGVANSADAFTPSGALLKAVLVGGAASIAGFEADTGLPIDPPPSFRQGFGRVLLGELGACSLSMVPAPQVAVKSACKGLTCGGLRMQHSVICGGCVRFPARHPAAPLTIPFSVCSKLALPGRHAWQPTLASS